MNALAASPNIFSRFMHLIKREVIEHRIGVLYTPIVIASLLILATLAAMIVGSGHLEIAIGAHGSHDWREHLDAATAEDFAKLRIALAALMLTYGLPIAVVSLVIGMFIILGSLYDERTERTVLFWKSMPVSDTATVLSKLVMVVLAMPIIVMAVDLAMYIIVLFMASIFTSLHGLPSWSVLWSNAPLLSLTGANLVMIPHYAFWAAPVYAWFMLASAFAPRGPLLFASVPIAVIAILEGIFLRSADFISEVMERFIGMPLFANLEKFTEHGSEDEAAMEIFGAITSPSYAMGQFFESFAKLEMWAGLAVAALFIFAAIQIRRRRTL